MAPLTANRPRPEAVLSHSASHLVSLDELAGIPAGAPMGPHHRPVPHIELVSTVKQAFSDRGYAVMREQYSVSHENARLFGTLDLMPTTGAPLVEGLEGGMAVGLRHANDQAFALGVSSPGPCRRVRPESDLTSRQAWRAGQPRARGKAVVARNWTARSSDTSHRPPRAGSEVRPEVSFPRGGALASGSPSRGSSRCAAPPLRCGPAGDPGGPPAGGAAVAAAAALTTQGPRGEA